MMRYLTALKLLILGCFILTIGTPAISHAKDKTNQAFEVAARKARFKGDIIFIKGGFNVFSGGMDQMANRLSRKGLKANVVSHMQTKEIIARIINHQKKYGRKPVILIGHSWGANEVIKVAKALLKKKIQVNFMAILAATNPPPIPRNVMSTTNYYFKKNGWGKPVLRGRGTKGRIRNIDLSKTPGINHFNLDESRKLQNQVIRSIFRHVRSRKKV